MQSLRGKVGIRLVGRNILGAACLIGLASVSGAAEYSPEQLEFFEKRVRPVLAENCHQCHSRSSKKIKAGLVMDSRADLLKGGDAGPAIVPGKPAESRVFIAVEYKDVDLHMPPKGKLTDSQIADIKKWIADGAAWPKENIQHAEVSGKGFDLKKRRETHWAWQPVKAAAPPKVKTQGWASGSIDRFILAKLEEKNLKPAKTADKRTLIRRASFDLTGLPPTIAETDAFLADESPRAFEKVVDRLMASQAFGERWGRHWQDLVRYAETMGHEFDYPIYNPWIYRDYIIRALNADVPYNQLVREHVAGDLIKKPRRHPVTGSNESIVGTSFYWFSQQKHSPVDSRQEQAELIDNQIDVLSKAFLGVTVSCARCHDHKFDAISTQDFYSLFGVLSSSRYSHLPIDSPKLLDAKRDELASLKSEIAKQIKPTKPSAAMIKLAKEDVEFVNFAKHGTEGWFRTGQNFPAKPTQAGAFLIQDGKPVSVAWGWMHSALLSRKLEGVLRSPTFDIKKRYIHIRAAGKGSRINYAVNNFTLIKNPIYGTLKQSVKKESPHWITVDMNMWIGQKCYLEFLDNSAQDPAGPGFPADAWIALSHVVFSDTAKAPTIEGPAKPASLAAKDQKKLDALLGQYAKLEKSIPRPTMIPGMTEGTPRDEFIFIRGGYKNLGKPAPRAFLQALEPISPGKFQHGSGRMELAEAIVHPDNPLTPRVIVNRIWHHLLGRGIVPTTDDFGVLGQRPTHPELLDWLANRFKQDGWSIKKSIRLVMLSSTYQMSSHPGDAAAETADPDNKWLHRARVRRLQGEAIRDAVLAVSGSFNDKMFGPPVQVHLTPFMSGRGRPRKSGPLDGGGRRSIYQETRRNFISPMMLAFDTPMPSSTIGRRNVSNVPAQALIMMNDPFVADQSKKWAARLLADKKATPQSRVSEIYQSAFGRPPTEAEIKRALGYINARANEKPEVVWADLCHVMFNVKEFLFVN